MGKTHEKLRGLANKLTEMVAHQPNSKPASEQTQLDLKERQTQLQTALIALLKKHSLSSKEARNILLSNPTATHPFTQELYTQSFELFPDDIDFKPLILSLLEPPSRS